MQSAFASGSGWRGGAAIVPIKKKKCLLLRLFTLGSFLSDVDDETKWVGNPK